MAGKGMVAKALVEARDKVPVRIVNFGQEDATLFPGTHIANLSFEFLICILLPANMPLMRCTNVFYKGDYPVTLLPPPRRLGPGTTWVRQLRSGSCHHPTAATKCNEQPSQATETPSVEKHAHPPRVVYCAIYLTLTLITKFRVSNLHITTR